MEGIEKQLLKFDTDPYNISVREYYEKDNIWKTLHVERDEMKHSSFLKWLFNLGSYDEGSPLYRLLSLLATQTKKDCQIDKNLLKAILNHKLELLSCRIKTEECVSSLSKIRYNDRLDIYFDCSIKGVGDFSKLEIIIENKVLTKEGKNKLNSISNPTQYEKDYESKSQTQRYYYACGKEFGLRSGNMNTTLQLFVFLSPFDDMPIDEHFIKISYQNLVDYVIEPYLKGNRINDYERETLNEYLRTLGNPNNKYNMIMANCSEEKEMLKEFFKRNGAFISVALDILENESQDETEKLDYIEMKERIINITKTGHPRRYFSINGCGKYKMYEVVGEFVKYKLNNGDQMNNIESEIKDYSKEPNQTHVDAVFSNVSRFEKGCYEVEYDKGVFYVTKEWGMGTPNANFHGFMNRVNEIYSNSNLAFSIKELNQ